MPLKIIRDDIAKVQADIIVNTANPKPIYSFGVDTAIYHEAGVEKLLAEREKIGFIEPGDIALTDAFNLKAKYIIHAVGCFYTDGNAKEIEIMQSCYNKPLEKAIELGCQSIAFPLMGTGSYGFPLKEALAIALNCINTFLLEHDINVTLVVFGDYSVELSNKLFTKIEEYVDQNYVDSANEMEYGYREYDSYRINNYNNNSLFKKKTIEDINIDKKQETFPYKFNNFVLKCGKKASDIYGPVFVSKQTYSKIFCDNHIPNKKAITGMCLTMNISLSEAEDLLASAGYVLSKSNNFDLVIRWCLENHYYEMKEINEYLLEKGYDVFG